MLTASSLIPTMPQCLLHAAAQLLAEQVHARAGARRHDPLGQLHDRCIGQHHGLNAFPGHAPLLRPDMPHVKVVESLPCELSEPRVVRQRPVAKVLGKHAGGIHECFLHDVRRVNSGFQPGVHAHRDHLPQARTVSREELLCRLLVPLGGSLQQCLRVRRLGSGHRRFSPTNLPPKTGKNLTG
jgi:hypothetical protein